ncbi:nucleoside diphosphate-linked moiety X motif 6-like isoform X2 [Mizuhopecten yessoensis]|uniref:nucleoside diphosphate-linked moiety X motif 6-like isoform X2 n=1 Tax=Mizuhopecten yessoensis TaxID=6573 RepID=UPI000B45917C|nr:nucleoside diphosphate-linked moiety X motif 6-like isoform X2 [Mizuhopecten yessoensis]
MQDSEGFKVGKDMYNGLTIDTSKQGWSDSVPTDTHQQLKDAIEKWKESGIRALWVKVHKAQSSFVSVCVQLGFDFHHAKPGYVMLNQWLAEQEENRLPGFASQYLGVAGFVLNDDNQVLVIQERFNISHKHWKLPGGLADEGEDLAVTSQREVFEETGVEAKFVSVLTFRHQHNFRYGCSDWYYICLMKAVGGSIKPCPQEIAECKWMDIDEYASHSSLTDTNKFVVQCYKEHVARGSSLSIVPTPVLSYNKKTYHNIYSIQPSSDAETDTSQRNIQTASDMGTDATQGKTQSSPDTGTDTSHKTDNLEL